MNHKSYSIIITDDHPLVITGLKVIINEQDQLNVTYTVNSGKALLEVLEKETADLIVLDISMPEMDGVQVATIIRAKYPEQKILCISTYYQPALYATLQNIPVQGFIPKLTDVNIIIDSIFKILNGDAVFIERNDELAEPNMAVLTEISGILSRRELEIIKLIKQGKSSKEIGQELYIALTTVETHRRNIIKKLNINTPNGLLKFAMEHL